MRNLCKVLGTLASIPMFFIMFSSYISAPGEIIGKISQIPKGNGYLFYDVLFKSYDNTGVYVVAPFIVLSALFFVVYSLIKTGGEYSDDKEIEIKKKLSDVRIVFIAGLATVILVPIIGAIGGASSPPSASGLVVGLVLGLGYLWYQIMFVFYPSILTLLLISQLPLISIGFIAVTTRTPAKEPVTRAAKTSRPDKLVERELGNILKAEILDGKAFYERLPELSRWKRKAWITRYKKLAREQAELREVANARTSSIQESAELAKDVKAMEITKAKRAEGYQ